MGDHDVPCAESRTTLPLPLLLVTSINTAPSSSMRLNKTGRRLRSCPAGRWVRKNVKTAFYLRLKCVEVDRILHNACRSRYTLCAPRFTCHSMPSIDSEQRGWRVARHGKNAKQVLHDVDSSRAIQGYLIKHHLPDAKRLVPRMRWPYR